MLQVILDFLFLDFDGIFKSLDVFLLVVDGRFEFLLLFVGLSFKNGKLELEIFNRDITFMLEVSIFLLPIFDITISSLKILFKTFTNISVLSTVGINFLVLSKEELLEVFNFFLEVSNLVTLSRSKFILLVVEGVILKSSILVFLSTLIIKNGILNSPVFNICIETINFIVEVITSILLFTNLILDFSILYSNNTLKFTLFVMESINLIFMVEFKTLNIGGMLVVELIVHLRDFIVSKIVVVSNTVLQGL